jgi:hypothetical protein
MSCWPPASPAVRARSSRTLTVGFSGDLGYARTDPVVADVVLTRLGELAGAGTISLTEAAVRLADPAGAWLPLTAPGE